LAQAQIFVHTSADIVRSPTETLTLTFAGRTMTALTCYNSPSVGNAALEEAPAFINGCFITGPCSVVNFSGISPPPGLEKSMKDSETPVKIKAPALKLSLDALCIDAPNMPEEKINLLPPGPYDFRKLAGFAPPPGLSESDGSTTVGGRGVSDSDSSDSDDLSGEMPSPKLCLDSLVGSGLVLSEVSELKATAPMFCPLLSPSTAALLMPDVAQRTPLRTKLRAKADLYVPAPFVPMAAVNDAWQNWHMENSSYDASADGWQSGEDYIRMARDILDKDVDGWQSGEDWLKMAKMTKDCEDSYESAEIYSEHDCTDSYASEWQ